MQTDMYFIRTNTQVNFRCYEPVGLPLWRCTVDPGVGGVGRAHGGFPGYKHGCCTLVFISGRRGNAEFHCGPATEIKQGGAAQFPAGHLSLVTFTGLLFF